MLDRISPEPVATTHRLHPPPHRSERTTATTAVRRRQTTIANPLGLHLRAASEFVALAQRFQASVRVAYKTEVVDGKSILDLTVLAAPCGELLEIEASGPDADAALEALVALVEAPCDHDAVHA